jgi:hypothetical protein
VTSSRRPRRCAFGITPGRAASSARSAQFRLGRRGCRRCRTASWWRRIKISAGAPICSWRCWPSSWTEISRTLRRLRGRVLEARRCTPGIRGLQRTLSGRSPCHLHAFRFAPAHARVAVCVTRAKARRGIGDMVRLRQAGAFLLDSKFVRTLPVTWSSACGVTWAGRRDGFPGRSEAMASRGDLRGSR